MLAFLAGQIVCYMDSALCRPREQEVDAVSLLELLGALHPLAAVLRLPQDEDHGVDLL